LEAEQHHEKTGSLLEAGPTVMTISTTGSLALVARRLQEAGHDHKMVADTEMITLTTGLLSVARRLQEAGHDHKIVASLTVTEMITLTTGSLPSVVLQPEEGEASHKTSLTGSPMPLFLLMKRDCDHKTVKTIDIRDLATTIVVMIVVMTVVKIPGMIVAKIPGTRHEMIVEIPIHLNQVREASLLLQSLVRRVVVGSGSSSESRRRSPMAGMATRTPALVHGPANRATLSQVAGIKTAAM